MAGFQRASVSDSGGGEVQQAADADVAQRHYQAGLAALEKNDLAAAEEEMQAAAQLAPKNAMIFYKLAVIQSKRGEWEAGNQEHIRRAEARASEEAAGYGQPARRGNDCEAVASQDS